MGDEGPAAFRAEAGQHVEAARRQDAVQQLADAQDGERRLFGGFDDDGVAGDERGGDLERHQQHRDVPRDDGADDAEGFADGDGEDVGGEGDALALQLAAEAAVHLEDVGDGAGLDAAFGAERLAGLERDEAGEFFLVLS